MPEQIDQIDAIGYVYLALANGFTIVHNLHETLLRRVAREVDSKYSFSRQITNTHQHKKRRAVKKKHKYRQPK